MLQRALYLAVHGEAFYHSQQYTLNKDQNQVNGTSALRYSCFYLRQQLKYEKVPKVTLTVTKMLRIVLDSEK